MTNMISHTTIAGTILAIAILLGGGVLMSSYDVDAISGTGTAEDPYSGVLQGLSEFDMLTEYTGKYFLVGTTINNFTLFNPNLVADSWKIDEGFGLSGTSIKNNVTINGTFTKIGDFHYSYVYHGTSYDYVIHVVDVQRIELDFLTNPITNGVVSYG